MKLTVVLTVSSQLHNSVSSSLNRITKTLHHKCFLPVSVAKADDDIYESRAAKKSILNKKKPRPTFTGAQVFELQNSFLKEKYLLQNERVKLAKKVDLTVTQAKIWFQNRRKRWHKEQNVSRAAANEPLLFARYKFH